MDYAIKAALRAIVAASGNHAAVVAALTDAIERADVDNQRGAVHMLEVFRDQVAKDGGVKLG